MKKTRYYFFSYSYTSDSANGFGNLTFTSNGFPSNSKIKSTCVNSISEMYPELKSISVVILWWNELKKTDYESFNNN